MARTTQEFELSDPLGRASQSLSSLPSAAFGGDEVSDMLGEKMVLNMGPSHPATHGVLRVVLELDGETITGATPHIGYLHRGSEKIAEAMQYNQFVPYTDRLDYLAPLANNVAYAMTVEKLMGWELPARGKAIRVICCEMARISSHMLGLGCFAMDTGAMTVFLYVMAEREKVYNLCELLTGARLTTSYTRVGGQIRDLPDGFLPQLSKFLDEVAPVVDEIEALLSRNRIFVDRTKDIGVVSKEMAIDYGLTGANLRGSGVNHDLRKNRPYLDYERYDFDIPLGTVGDCYDRYLVRVEEVRQSIKILRQVIEKLPSGPVNVADPKNVRNAKREVLTKMEELINHFILYTEGVNAPAGEVYFAAENPKGELGFYLNSLGGGSPHRLKVRSPSFTSISILGELLKGHLIGDIPAIIGSLDFVMGECDR
jgi:NADH-quinone oxidoreductase subunit D